MSKLCWVSHRSGGAWVVCNDRVSFADEGGEAVETVLGLSMTSSSIGWVLLDGPGADAATLDHDAFDVGGGSSNDGDISKHTAAVRGVQTIAASSGQQVKSIGITWTADADAKASLLLKSLSDMGFDNVVPVRLSEATRTWARQFGRALGFEKAAVCVVESSAVTALSFGYDTVRSFATHTRESADGISCWLKEVLDTNNLTPEHLYLIGPRGDIELISRSLGGELTIPVVTSEEAQLLLARGAALAVSPNTETIAVPLPDTLPVAVAPKQKRTWFGPPTRAATVLVAGAIAVFALAPEFAGQPESQSTENRSASSSSATSVQPTKANPPAIPASIHAVPAPAAAPPAPEPLQPMAVQPASVPPPPDVLPPDETSGPPTADAGQETASPAVEQTTPQPPVTAQPLSVPHVPESAPRPAGPAPQPALAPPAPQPAVAPAAPPPALAPPAPIAPPAPAPIAPPAAIAPAPGAPPPAEPAPAPPPDPVQFVFGPLFGALP